MSGDQIGLDIDLDVLLDSNAVGEVGVAASPQLLAFTNAAHVDPDRLAEARADVQDVVGEAGLIEAAATVAIFNGLVRVADGTGIQLDAGVLADSADFRAKYGIDDYAGAANTDVDPLREPVAVVDRSSVADLFA